MSARETTFGSPRGAEHQQTYASAKCAKNSGHYPTRLSSSKGIGKSPLVYASYAMSLLAPDQKTMGFIGCSRK